jgi:hypothetical protein
MENDRDSNRWQGYRTIERLGYRKRLIVAMSFLCFGLVMLIASDVIFHVASGTGKWTDLFRVDGIDEASPIGLVGFLALFILLMFFMFYKKRITKKQYCPKCRQPCEDKESASTGQIYLVCHHCKLKWDTGINNSNG